jgi:hypothetical protein
MRDRIQQEHSVGANVKFGPSFSFFSLNFKSNDMATLE